MSQIFNKMRIDVRQDIVDIITAKQNDSNSRFLDVFLYDGATPIDLTGEEVRIYMRKPDGTEIFNNGTITDAVNGRCEFELTSQALGAVGVLQCEISIWQDNTEILTTQTFHVFVTESLRSDGSVESSNEYGALVVLFQNLHESMDLMQTMVEQFGTPSGSVDASTFWQMLEELYAVNSEALANASVSEVLNRIGLNTDTESSGTLFGLANEISDSVLENRTQILTAINNNTPSKIIQASDDVLKTYISSVTTISGKKITGCNFLVRGLRGSLRITFTYNNSTNGSTYYYILKNGVQIESNRATNSTYVTTDIDVSVENNDIITVQFYAGSNYPGNVKLLTVSGTIYDAEDYAIGLTDIV